MSTVELIGDDLESTTIRTQTYLQFCKQARNGNALELEYDSERVAKSIGGGSKAWCRDGNAAPLVVSTLSRDAYHSGETDSIGPTEWFRIEGWDSS